ncbi:MAG: thiolase [Acidimicrobiaceae bacterium]|jgi:acetyl-CoA acetyltransferase|nr:thiolase [Acidimicrobiaceae bacterium]MCH2632240.1 thiolase family protein [Acidimicrobiales bacterium]HCK74894.1 thiolase [Acidimicrobiaceae bacterium]|tara:strand:+ start:4436 stop:5584 length:1149 start_codon:yes stop_codon:yes gene_type:complete
MTNKKLLAERPVFVVGIGLHPYQRRSDTTYVRLGLTAVREALTDAGVAWRDVESAYTGTALLGMGSSRIMLSRLGATGIPMTQVENASASGSSSVAQGCLEISSGRSDVVLALGVDKPRSGLGAAPGQAGIENLEGGAVVPFTHFALLASEYMHTHGVSDEQVAMVAVKNHRNGSLNKFAQRQKVRTMQDVLSEPISGSLTRLQCCPVGEGAAAVILASEDGIKRLGLDASRAVRIIGSATRTEGLYGEGVGIDAALTSETGADAFEEAGIEPSDLDVLEVHDAFAIEELLYAEALGLCKAGEAASLIESGYFDIGGQCALSPSGGLLAMGHPIGPTGVGQVVEVTRQLRGEAERRQQPNARLGMAHMVGVGAVCVVHVLAK